MLPDGRRNCVARSTNVPAYAWAQRLVPHKDAATCAPHDQRPTLIATQKRNLLPQGERLGRAGANWGGLAPGRQLMPSWFTPALPVSHSIRTEGPHTIDPTQGSRTVGSIAWEVSKLEAFEGGGARRLSASLAAARLQQEFGPQPAPGPADHAQHTWTTIDVTNGQPVTPGIG